LKINAALSKIAPIALPWIATWTVIMAIFHKTQNLPFFELGLLLHFGMAGCCCMVVLAALRMAQKSQILSEKWTFPLIFLLFLLIWLIPVAASWVGRANWGMTAPTEVLLVAVAFFRQMKKVSPVNISPILMILGCFLVGFWFFHRARAIKNSQRIDFFWQKIGKKGWWVCFFAFFSVMLLPFLLPFSRLNAYESLSRRDPFSAFFFLNLKEKYISILNSKKLRPKIKDGNIPDAPLPVKNAQNVIILCLDALRADRLAAYGGAKGQMPHLDSLISSGFFQKIDHSMSISTTSIEDVYSILYSNYYELMKTPLDRPSFAWLLRKYGYETHFLLAGMHRGFHGMGQFYESDATTFFEGLDSKISDPNDDQILFEGLKKLPNATEKPAFFYIHMMSSHHVGTKHADFQRHQPAQFEFWETDIEKKLSATRNHYQNGVEQADLIVGQLLKNLDEKGFLKNSIVWLLADHGEALGERDAAITGHGGCFWKEVMRVPMLFHNSTGQKLTNNYFANTLDLAPTTVKMLHLPVPDRWIGQSLTEKQTPRISDHRSNSGRAWIYSDSISLKKIQINYQDSAQSWYDLKVDPMELNNLFGKKPSGDWSFNRQ
jgi:glucan phosphoethanolaminetransferase (alkaline phosphatase superfamily)